MNEIESLAYREGASEQDFMEEAGSGVALVVYDFIESQNIAKQVTLICGKGNNAADAYVAGVHLMHLDCEVVALQLTHIDDCSQLCRTNYHRFLQEGGRVMEISTVEELIIPTQGVIVDGIVGTGFDGNIREPYASIIEELNNCDVPIIAIDIPSGLNGTTGEASLPTIRAQETAFLGLPKSGFFLGQGWDYVGRLRYVDFGLSKSSIEQASSNLTMITSELVKPNLPKIKNSRHKYQAGHVVGLAGSKSMPGAAILSSLSALRGGAGLVHLLYPSGMEVELAASPPELIKIAYTPGDVAPLAELMNKAAATFIGPGLGRTEEIRELLRQLLPLLTKPCVIDADALYWLAQEDFDLPAMTVLTPHRGEMHRLLQLEGPPPPITEAYLKLCQQYAQRKRATLILKGGPTYIFHNDNPILVNARGDPGMATAGSGDLLTGLLAGLLAQGATAEHAAPLGVYIHAIAGECAAMEFTSYCFVASDILYRFPEGFLLYDTL
jgi:NAD(P)H-hydrate epimerase